MQQVQSIQSVPLLTASTRLVDQFGERNLELSNNALLDYTHGRFDYERVLMCVGARYIPNLKRQELTLQERCDGFRIIINSIHRGLEPENSVSMWRIFDKGDSGGWFLVNDGMALGSNLRRNGLGTHIFASQVLNAARCGIKAITTQATRSYTENGYYTWPRLGYDAPIRGWHKSEVLNALPELDDNENLYISDLMKTMVGRAWWLQYGYDESLTFDLTPGSLSRQVLEEYLKEKGYYVQ